MTEPMENPTPNPLVPRPAATVMLIRDITQTRRIAEEQIETYARQEKAAVKELDDEIGKRLAVEVVALALEEPVRLDVDDDVQVAGAAAAPAG